MSKVQVDKVVNLSDDGAPQLTYGAELPVGYGLTGAGGLNISGVVTAASAVFSGNVTIGGTLTYEDVTNVDVVGVSTFAGRMNVNSTINANEGIKVIGVSTLAAVTGTTGTFSGAVSGTTGTFSGDVDIADKIVHTGDTNTAIRFPAADAISAETAGTERIRITDDGKVGINTNSPASPLEVQGDGGTNDATITFTRHGSPSNDAVIGQLLFRKSTDSVAIISALRESAADDAYLQFQTQPTGGAIGERLRITSTGMMEMRSDMSAADQANRNIFRFTDTDTSTASNQSMGRLQWYSSDASGGGACVKAEIEAVANDATPEANLLFKTHTSSNTTPTERLRITGDGDVGIGTASPDSLLHIFGANTGYAKIETGDGGTNPIVMHENPDRIWHTGLRGDTSDGYVIRDATASANRLIIDTSGKLGIGQAPNTKVNAVLSVFAATGDDDASDWGADGIFQLDHSGTAAANNEVLLLGAVSGGVGQIASGFGFGRDSTSNWGTYISFKNHSTSTSNIDELKERMRIISSGDVIVHGTSLNNSAVAGQALQINGTTRPTLILRGNASGSNTGEIQFADNSGSDDDNTGIRAGLIQYDHSNNNMSFRVAGTYTGLKISGTNGRLERNFTGSSSSDIDYDGMWFNNSGTTSGVYIRFWQTTSGANQIGSISHTTSATSFNTSSDYRLKENAVGITSAITRLKTLKPYRFNFKADASTTVDGFFAHEVTTVPEAITGTKDEVDSNGDPIYQGIDQSKLVPLLTAALQEAIAKIETLETKVAALESS